MHIETTAAGDPPLTSKGIPEGAVPVPTGSDGIQTEAGPLHLWRAANKTPAGADLIRAAIESGDVAGLMTIDSEIVPFYCGDCRASYCETHWTTWPEFDPEWPAWFEELRGVCPLGHERRIHD